MSRLPDPPHPVAEAATRDLETAIALTTHQCAALAAGVQAAVAQAVAELNDAVVAAERRIEQAAARAVERIERAAAGS